MVEHRTLNPQAEGSSPSALTRRRPLHLEAAVAIFVACGAPTPAVVTHREPKAQPVPDAATAVAAAPPAVTSTAIPVIGDIHLIAREPKRVRAAFGSLRIELTRDG